MKQTIWWFKLLLAVVAIIPASILYSCEKLKCYTWENYLECQEKVARGCDNYYFNPYRIHLQTVLCGDKRDGIYTGYSYTEKEDAEKIVIRHYIKKVN